MVSTADPAIQAALQESVGLLQSGNFTRSAEILRKLASELPQAEMPWELLARAEEGLGNLDAAMAALDQRLALDKRNIGALLLKGLMFERQGDDRSASSHYSAALAQNAANQNCPKELLALLKHAGQFQGQASARYQEHLLDQLDKPESPRVSEAIDILLGRKGVFLQQPSMFYFPGLPQRQFYETADFPWLEPMLALLPQMQAELDAVESRSSQEFVPYVQSTENRPAPNNPLLDDVSWGAFWFYQQGERVEPNATLCPATMEALEFAPMPRIDSRSPMALWSRLVPGTHIQPHHGLLNTRLICHIPIRTAPGCSLRVGNETRTWADGVPLIFDDSIEHEARNEGNQTRVVLLFEIWRPEISDDERAELIGLFEAIDLYGSE